MTQGTPFRFEGPVDPELLIDRQAELATLGRRAGDRVGVRLAAPRRYGKTSLLLAHAAQLRETGWRTAHVDFSRVTDMTDAARRVVAAYAPLDSTWMRAHLSGLLGRLGLSVGTAGASVTVGPRPAAPDPEAAEAVMHRLLDLPKTLWERDQTSTLVIFDEFQDLLVARQDLDGLLRSVIQYHGDAAAYVYAGSEPSMMRGLFDARERPLFGQADPLALERLPLDDVLADLAERFEIEGLDPGEALGELAVFADGHPQRVMLLCYLPPAKRSLIEWHNDTFASGPSWAEFAKAMGIGGDAAKDSGAVYVVSDYRAAAGHREDLEKMLTTTPVGDTSTGNLLLQHIEGASWNFLGLVRYDSWDKYAEAQKTSVAQSGRNQNGWYQLRNHVACHHDTLTDRLLP